MCECVLIEKPHIHQTSLTFIVYHIWKRSNRSDNKHKPLLDQVEGTITKGRADNTAHVHQLWVWGLFINYSFYQTPQRRISILPKSVSALNFHFRRPNFGSDEASPSQPFKGNMALISICGSKSALFSPIKIAKLDPNDVLYFACWVRN